MLDNAIKFSSKNSAITVRIEEQNAIAKITINDKGIGMSEEVLVSLSDANTGIIREGTRGEKGYGLGWSICQQIIRAHKGKLVVSSKENLGTTITIELDTVTVNA
jgi:two-component system sensor histidine kinase CiaH